MKPAMSLIENTDKLKHVLQDLSKEYAELADKESDLPNKRMLQSLSDKFNIIWKNEFGDASYNEIEARAKYFENLYKNKKYD